MKKTQKDSTINGKNKFKTQLYSYIFVIVILIGLITPFAVGNILIKTKYNEVLFTMSLVAKNIEMRIDDAKNIVELAAQMSDVAAHNSKEAEQYLNSIIDKNPTMWSHFLITEKSGLEIAHTEGSIHYGKSLAERDYFLVPWNEKKIIVAQPVYSLSTGRKIIAIGVPTFYNGKPNGVLVGFIHLGYVSELLNANDFSKNSYLFMTNNDGTVSAHKNDDYVLVKRIGELTIDTDVSSAIKELKSGIKLSKIENKWGLVSYAPIETYNLSIVSFIPFFEAFFAPIIVVIVLLAIFAAIIFLLILWLKIEKSREYGKAMENTANTDKLTGLKNRHWLSTITLDSYCKDFLSIIFFDIDDFKRYNDEHDHAYGDEVLKFVGKSLIGSTRPDSDTAIRYAGDEFLVLFKDTPVVNVKPIAQRLMTTLKSFETKFGKEPIYISCGIASAKKGEITLEELIARADKATYDAKHSGKNCVVIA